MNLYDLKLKEIETIKEYSKNILEPEAMGSYSPSDCIFLLKNINNLLEEQGNEEREGCMSDGVHYSEMLPIEYMPSDEYIELFYKSLKEDASRLAGYVGYVSELIYKERGDDVILVSLARAGSPIGVLIKRYLNEKYGIDAPHYSISIIRGKGFDTNALMYILGKHLSANLQFVDGWTGKGAIKKVLNKGCEDFYAKYGISLNPSLAVLADPSESVEIFGTREDFLIPSACLNSTVSGLMSRTVERADIIGEHDFHGAKFYDHWFKNDLSNFYIDEISKYFNLDIDYNSSKGHVTDAGWKEVERIMDAFNMSDINKIKPGVGETTRVLLRRVPWKILVKDINSPDVQHILILARDRNVPVEEYKDMFYSCIGLIKEV